MSRRKLATAFLISTLLGMLFVPGLVTAAPTTRPAIVETAEPDDKPLLPTPKPLLKVTPGQPAKPLLSVSSPVGK